MSRSITALPKTELINCRNSRMNWFADKRSVIFTFASGVFAVKAATTNHADHIRYRGRPCSAWSRRQFASAGRQPHWNQFLECRIERETVGAFAGVGTHSNAHCSTRHPDRSGGRCSTERNRGGARTAGLQIQVVKVSTNRTLIQPSRCLRAKDPTPFSLVPIRFFAADVCS